MKTLLLVRPENRLAQDVALCQQNGIAALPFPLLKLAHQHEVLRQLPQYFQAACAAFWVSPSAVEIAAQYADLSSTALPHIAVGKATAHALAQAGAQNIHVSSHGNDSTAALALPIWQTLPANHTIIIIRGDTGREELAHHLQQMHFQIQYAPIYRRIAQSPDWQAFQAAQIHAAWITSTQLADLLFTQANVSLTQNLKSLIYFTHHRRIVERLREYHATQIYQVEHLQNALHQLKHINKT
ncbi:uroporphyrinogen-III synthase [Alysiella filiformis]|uniref:Uroporphyrinogen-III synthase n=1 Tax=Alysiella filiformis DSM 16848 TaxID=1120981 RepID=A0A286EDD9_9NEIS|nr:uroporphyrinogen-III synthase [Alysiella filiformis]QMT31201.1 uroporphyrinogen-III synthase [Alysiella filiformis]UBQ55803.1 uroporphyrinogen-III synthase [Alysiella filiformis DSM 16848]SOD68925.1 uroporphyrinogen-III synthase [Alysiella filiformis DSM 16848]